MEIDAAVSFGEVLKELRVRKRLSRPTLARLLHVHPSSIEKWERGDVLPDRARVEELIRALELTDAQRLLLLEAHAGHRILPSLHNIPAAQNPYFTGRKDILMQLHDHLAPGSQVALTQAISGLGGIGKTQVALHYVYRFQKAYSHVLWVTADSFASLSAEFVRLARDLDLPEKDEKDQGKIVQAVQRWLREYLDWLPVLDNVEDLRLVDSFIPTGHLGSVLLTTRRQVTEPVAQALALDVLSDDEGALLLLKRAKRLVLDASFDKVLTPEIVVAKAITRQVGGLPLALDQAGAYIAETGCSLSNYLELFKQEQKVLLERRGTVPGGHPQSVATTFSLTFEQLRQKNEAVIELLTLWAFLAPEAIPLELITKGAVHIGGVLESVAAHASQLDQALEMLQAYSLVRRDGESRTLSIHRLVQVVLRNTLEEMEKHTWVVRDMLAINAAFPHVELNTWPQCERLLPHALLVAQYIETYQIIGEEAGRLLYETASYLQARGRYPEAEPLYLRALHIREQQLGPKHPDVANSLNNLANLYADQGKYEEAEPLYRRALTIREQQFGSEHSDVADSLNNLAILYYQQGKYTQTEPLCQRALHIWEQLLGPGHLEVSSSLNNLANLYADQGKYEEAEPLYRRALAIREKQLGPEHPDVATSLNNLATLYRDQGKYAQAEPFYQCALAIWENQLGPEHPDVAISLNNLANLYADQGKYEEAEPLYRRALAIREKQLGPEHPDVAFPLIGLANLYSDHRKYTQAEPLYWRALTIREKQLGPEHPQVATSLNKLANLYSDHGKYTRAESLYQRALTIREKQLGPEHPQTAETLHDLAAFQEMQGNHQEAFALYQRALTIREQRLGPEHPKTITTRQHLISLKQPTLQETGPSQEDTLLE